MFYNHFSATGRRKIGVIIELFEIMNLRDRTFIVYNLLKNQIAFNTIFNVDSIKFNLIS